jgi:hypothetical protein
MKPEEITIQQMAKAIKLFKKEYFDYRNELKSIFALVFPKKKSSYKKSNNS